MAAFSAKVGTFIKNAGTGNQAVTGLGFQPKAYILYGTRNTADATFLDDAKFFYGFTDGSFDVGMYGTINDNLPTTDGARAYAEGRIVRTVTGAQAVDNGAGHVSMDSDGFTINWSTNDGVQFVVVYIALGGTDLLDATGVTDAPVSPGNVAETGTGFLPTGVFFATVWDNAVEEESDRDNFPALGFTDGTRQGTVYIVSEDGQAATDSWRYQRTDRCVSIGTSTTGAVSMDGHLVSLDSDGFTIGYDTSSLALGTYYLALGGVPVYVGSFIQQAGTGIQTITDVGHRPVLVVMMSYGTTPQTTVQTEHRFSFGAATDTTQHATWMGDLDAADPSVNANYLDAAKVLVFADPDATHGSTVIDASATFAGTRSTGFAVNWGVNDGVGRQILYMAIGLGEGLSRPKIDGSLAGVQRLGRGLIS